MARHSEPDVAKPPDAYLPPTTEYMVEEIIEIATEATTLYDVCRRTWLSRGTVRKVLRACKRYHEVEFWFGNDTESAIARIDQLREQIGHSHP